jgi:enoyl-CoA hydratase/carnithine racemase
MEKMVQNESRIVTSHRDGIFYIEICRPEKKNALTASMYAALAVALESANGNPDVRAVLIHGQPSAFTAGNDLGDFVCDPPTVDDAPVFRFLHCLRTLEQPLVAAVTGIAIGVGTTLLLHCDLAYCGTSACFQLPFVNLGLCPEAASSLLLPMLTGHVRAAEMLLLGEPFDAAKAREVGLVNAVLPDNQVLSHAIERAQSLAAQPAASLRLTKCLLKSAYAELVKKTMEEEAHHFKARLDSAEAKEAFAAFFDKRKPDFSRFS